MDRNTKNHASNCTSSVALRKESVDRNLLPLILLTMFIVALRKESVDRNIIVYVEFYNSLVALRKESVDRNKRYTIKHLFQYLSLSARRAWIEIECAAAGC